VQTFRSLRHRNYRLLWTGTLIGSAGNWMEQIAVGWVILTLTDSPLLLGTIQGLRALPFLVLGPFGGVAADRVNRRVLLIGSQILIFFLACAMAFLLLTDVIRTWHIVVISLALGIVWSMSFPVRQALLPNLVEEDDLMNAIALQSTGFQSSAIVGPAIAGLLLGWVGAGWVFVINAALYLLVVIMTWQIRFPEREVQEEPGSVMENLLEGLTYIRNTPVVLSVILLALVPWLFGWPIITLLPVFARDVLDIGAIGLGVLNAAAAIGSVSAALVLASLPAGASKGWILLGSLFLLGAGLVLFGVSGWVPLSLACLVLLGAGRLGFLTTNSTIIQSIVPDALRGRVMSIVMMDYGFTPLGNMLAGALADFFSPPLAAITVGVMCLVTAASVTLMVPRIRNLR
jgi:MFS family permease